MTEKPPADDRYTPSTCIGEGGMALVHEAFDHNLQRTVAMKRIRPELADTPEYLARFQEEARIMAQLDHPGAIPVYEIGKTDDSLFLAMKRVHGKTLEALLHERQNDELWDQRRQLTLIDIFERVCQTMAAAHCQHIIHRDLKPDNIMIDDFGAVYVMDWGIAKQLGAPEHVQGQAAQPAGHSQHTRLGVVMGTPAYMSPELAMGRAALSGRQSDVFSLGAILYEMLTAVQPFAKASADQSMQGVIHQDPDNPRQINRGCHRTLAAICMKALNKDPHKRYRDAGELAADIRAFREFQPVSAIRYGWRYRLWAWYQRRPALSATLATLLVALGLSAVGLGTLSSVGNLVVTMAYDDIDALQAQIVRLRDAISDYERRLADPATSAAERAALRAKRDGAVDRIEAKSRFSATLAYSIAAMTMFSHDTRAERLMYDSLMGRVRQAMRQQRYPLAHEYLQFVLQHSGTIRDPFNLSRAELAEVRRLFAEVESHLQSSP